MTVSTPEIRIVREKVVYESRFGCLFDDDVEFLPQGISGTYLRWQWKAPFSVAVLPILTSGEIVLIESFRHSARQLMLEVPKGFGRSEATPSQIAQEELAEESGLNCPNLTPIGTVVTDPAFAYAHFYLFIAKDCSPVGAYPEDSEVITRIVKYKLREIPDLLVSGAIADAVTILMLQHLLLVGVDNVTSPCQALSERD